MPVSFFLLAAVIIATSCQPLRASNLFSIWKKVKSASEPVLYLAQPDSNSMEMLVADANFPAANKSNLVVVTHGWYEKKPWPRNLALAIRNKVEPNEWLCGWYDWHDQARVINPIDAAEYARDIGGPLLGERIVQLSKGWRHIHLIGHSAGSWVISEAAKVIAKETNAKLHLTFLDAYVPPFWDEKELGVFGSDPNVVCWAEHYFTRDLTLGATEKRLTHAHNVDLSNVTPGINDHEFPHYWYHATVIGRYATGQRYEGKELFNRLGTFEYGFARALEAGTENWKASTVLKMGNKPVKIERPKKSIQLWLKELFRKSKKGNLTLHQQSHKFLYKRFYFFSSTNLRQEPNWCWTDASLRVTVQLIIDYWD